MCRCWDFGRKKGRSQKQILPRLSTNISYTMDDMGRSSRASHADEVELVDEANNDRLSWDKGVSVEVWSEANQDWFLGKIIEAVNTNDGRIVKVVYNKKTKSIPVFSRKLRPLIVNNSPAGRTKAFTEALQEAYNMLDEHKPQIETVLHDAFISYSQNDAKDAAGVLYLLLKLKGLNAWFDQQQDEISVAGMSEGISRSCVFILFLTKSYFKKTFTVFELETALALNKPIIVVWEGDDLCGGLSDFELYLEACPEKYKTRLFEKEALRFERRKYLQEAQINVVAERISQARISQVDGK